MAQEEIDNYINKLTSYKNVEYQNDGDYFDTFANSDGIIHDCSSFLVEWLYTGKPCCYMLKNEQEINKIFAELGQACLKHYYKAYNEQQIKLFIEDVILNGKDEMKDNRIKFANKKIKINYPQVSNKIIDIIKREVTK